MFLEYDNWFITTPGRTGSMLIVNIIRRVYREQNVDLKLITSNEISKDIISKNQVIIHDHQKKFFPLKKGKYIISIRNPIEICLSHFIAKNTNIYHYSTETPKLEITPFHLNIKDFVGQYHLMLEWYNTIPKDLFSISTIINYNEFKNDPLSLCSILDLPPLDIEEYQKSSSLIKTPGNYESYIKNWDEVNSHIYHLNKKNYKFFEEKKYLFKR
jgi:hypothetical protein